MTNTTELLTCPDESMRLTAVRDLAENPGDEALPRLVSALNDKSWRVRREAVKGLSGRNDVDTMAEILRAMREEHGNLSILSASIQILSQAGVDTLSALAGLTSDGSEEVRTSAALALGAQGNPQAIPPLLRLLDDPDTNVRYHAIEALGKLRAGQAADALADIATSRDFFLAFPALDALAAIGVSRVAHGLLPLLEDELLRVPTLDTLARIGTEEIISHVAVHVSNALAGNVARTLAVLHARYELLYRRGSIIAELVRRTLSATSVQTLVHAAKDLPCGDAPSLALVLSWLEGPAIDEALLRLLTLAHAREAVIEALVRRGAEGARLIVDQLGSEEFELRQALVGALGRTGDTQAVPAVLHLLQTDEDLIATIAGALAMIGDRRSYRPLLRYVGHPSAPVRRAVVSALNSLGHPDMAADLTRLLRDSNPLVRESAVRIAGYAGFAACADLLLECCRDARESVRRSAIESLACLEDPRGLAMLGEALRQEVPSVRTAAARALGHLDTATSWPLLERALGDEDPWVRYFAIRSVARQRAKQSLETLIRIAREDGATQVRVAATEALGAFGGESVMPILVALAQSEEQDLARAAQAALGATASVAALRRTAVGQDTNKALEAIAALGRIATAEAVNALVEVTALPVHRDTCIAELVRSSPGQIDALARGLRHEQLDVRRSVVIALGQLAAVNELRQALTDREPSIRFAAVVALTLVTDPHGIPELVKMAESDPDPEVRRTAQARLRG